MVFDGAKHSFALYSSLISHFVIFKKIKKSMQKGTHKDIVDAERHRRTPRLSAISGKAIRGGLWAWAEAIQCETLVEIGHAGA